jgi:hypothetical protein
MTLTNTLAMLRKEDFFGWEVFGEIPLEWNTT